MCPLASKGRKNKRQIHSKSWHLFSPKIYACLVLPPSIPPFSLPPSSRPLVHVHVHTRGGQGLYPTKKINGLGAASSSHRAIARPRNQLSSRPTVDQSALEALYTRPVASRGAVHSTNQLSRRLKKLHIYTPSLETRGYLPLGRQRNEHQRELNIVPGSFNLYLGQ